MSDHTTTLHNLRQQVAQFVAERDWDVYHTPKNLSMSIAIEAAELMELFQWQGNEESREAGQIEQARQDAAQELADILIYCLALANVLDVDTSQAIEAKLALNRRRYPPGYLPSRYGG